MALSQTCYFGYNTYTILTTHTSGTAGTVTLVGTYSFPTLTQIYAVQISISSIVVPATSPGIYILRKQTLNSGTVGTTTIAFPAVDTFCSVPCVPTSLGIVGDGKMIFGREKEGILIDKNNEIGVYFYSTTASLSINALTTFYGMPVVGA